ncbi:10046_t:CDS:1, partial [Scutellospora calospora]
NVKNTTRNILLEDDEGKDKLDDANVNNDGKLSKQELEKDNGKLNEDCSDNSDEITVVKKNNEIIDLDCACEDWLNKVSKFRRMNKKELVKVKTYLPELKELDTIAIYDEAHDCYSFGIRIKKDEDTIKGRKTMCEWALKPVRRNKIANDENCQPEGPLILKSETNQVVKVKSSRLEGKSWESEKQKQDKEKNSQKELFKPNTQEKPKTKEPELMPIERKSSTEKEANKIETCESKPRKLIQEERRLIRKDIDKPNLRETTMQIEPEPLPKKKDNDVERKPNKND